MLTDPAEYAGDNKRLYGGGRECLEELRNRAIQRQKMESADWHFVSRFLGKIDVHKKDRGGRG